MVTLAIVFLVVGLGNSYNTTKVVYRKYLSFVTKALGRTKKAE